MSEKESNPVSPGPGKAKPAKVSRRSEVVDRIVVKQAENAKFVKWQAQVNERFQGFGRITKNDIANFLFRKHPDSLSEEELTELGIAFYDEVTWTRWAFEKIKRARKDGVSLTLEELIAQRAVPTPVKKMTRIRARQNASGDNAVSGKNSNLENSIETPSKE